MSVREVARLTRMIPWFLHQLREITLAQGGIARTRPEDITEDQLRRFASATSASPRGSSMATASSA